MVCFHCSCKGQWLIFTCVYFSCWAICCGCSNKFIGSLHFRFLFIFCQRQMKCHLVKSSSEPVVLAQSNPVLHGYIEIATFIFLWTAAMPFMRCSTKWSKELSETVLNGNQMFSILSRFNEQNIKQDICHSAMYFST